MSREERLAELLERWEETPTQGDSYTPEDFCSDCPELLDDFRKILGKLGPVNAVLIGNGVGNVPAEEFTPDVDAGRYKPISFHARGGLGMVFLAEDGEIGRSVALKCMQRMAATDSGSRRRFLAEAEITGRLEHPGIVPVYGMGQDANGRPFYAMRFIQGETLGDAAERFHQANSLDASERNVELRRLLRHFIAVCETMAYSHSRGVIHRDLKPANIMIGPYGETLVVDWGLAKQIISSERRAGSVSDRSSFGSSPVAHAPGSPYDSDASVIGQTKGTPAYMSPEQAAGQWDRVGPPSDIYSLGSTLFVLLTGKRPYEGRNIREVIDMVKLGAFFPPRTLNPSIPKALDAICRKAMVFRQEDRYADARDMARDLERWLADEPVAAYREPFVLRARRWLKRHRTLVTSCAAALIVGMTALGALAIQQRQNNLALQDKNDKLRDKNDELQAANVKVEKNFGYARQAVKDIVDEAIGNPLLLRPGGIRFKEALLKKARDYYTNFLASQKADDPDVQEELAQAHFYVGYMAQLKGIDGDARSEYREALIVYDRLKESNIGKAERGINHATVLIRLGLLECDRGENVGIEMLKRGLADMRTLREEDPANPLYAMLLSLFHAESAGRFDLAGLTGEAADALANAEVMFKEAFRLLGKESAEELRFAAAGSMADRARLRYRNGQIEESIDLADRAGQLVAELVREKPADPDYLFLELIVGVGRAEILNGQGKFDEALALCEKAREGFGRVARSNPDIATHQFLFGQACHGSGDSLRHLKKFEQAAERYREARHAFAGLVQISPDNLEFKLNLGNACQHLYLIERERNLPAKGTEALAEARVQFTDLERIRPGQPTFQLNMAIVENSEGMLLLKSRNFNLPDLFRQQIQRVYDAIAHVHFLKAIAITTKVTKQFPDNPHFLFMHATVQRNLAITSQSLGQDTEAVALLEHSRDAFRQLADEHPDMCDFLKESERSQFALANSYSLAGANQFNAFKPTDVTEWFAKAQPIIDELLERDASNKEYIMLNERNLNTWCVVLRQLAVEEFQTKDYAKGLALFERALPIARKLQAAKPQNKEWPMFHSKILIGTGAMCKERLTQLDRSKPVERVEMIRVASLAIEVFNESDPVLFAQLVQELVDLRKELRK